MAIRSYQKEISPGVFKTFYEVHVEGVNKYTGRRVQAKRKDIPSAPKARQLHQTLWVECREKRPDIPQVNKWGHLLLLFLENAESQVRSKQNPYGISPRVMLTKKSRFVHLKSWDSLHPDLITANFIEKELNDLEAKGICSRSLTSAIQKEIKCVFSFAVNSGILKENPLLHLKNRKIPKRRKVALTHEETNKFLHQAYIRKHPFYYVWLFALCFGLRRSEIDGLMWIDFDFENGLLHVRRQRIPGEGIRDFPKDKEERVVPIPKKTIPELERLKLSSDSEFVITLSDKKWQTGHQSQVTREFCREIGIKEVSFHQLRATYITLALVDNIPLGIVKESVGHAKLSTTDGYFRSSGIDMRGKADNLSIEIPDGDERFLQPKAVI